ncbi:MAG: hypothetical protein LUH54_02015 [Firmicutes bacterium]|nr:hypothetical protein [Bacillota bacterium]
MYDEYINVLYCIDTDTNQLCEVYSESTCLPGAYIASIDSYIVTRQSIRTDDNYLITYLELLNPETGEIEKSSEPFYLNDNTNVGVYMINMCADDNLIYALVDERLEDGTNSPIIYVYNDDLEVTDEINMDSVSEYILSSRVGDMCVWGNCIYMGNYYLEAFVGVIEDGSIKCLLQGESLEAAIQYDTDCDPLFFVRGSNVFYDFDSSSNSLKEIELELDGDYKISNVMIESDNVLVDLTYYATDYDDAKPDRIYRVSRDSLEKVS